MEQQKLPLYPKPNPMYELQRLAFYAERDGVAGGYEAAKQMKHIYLATTKAFRSKPGGKNHPYRFSYVESAYSARHIIRNKLLG